MPKMELLFKEDCVACATARGSSLFVAFIDGLCAHIDVTLGVVLATRRLLPPAKSMTVVETNFGLAVAIVAATGTQVRLVEPSTLDDICSVATRGAVSAVAVAVTPDRRVPSRLLSDFVVACSDGQIFVVSDVFGQCVRAVAGNDVEGPLAPRDDDYKSHLHRQAVYEAHQALLDVATVGPVAYFVGALHTLRLANGALEVVATQPACAANVNAARLCRDGTRFFATMDDGCVVLRDVASGADICPPFMLTGEASATARGLRASTSRERFVVVSETFSATEILVHGATLALGQDVLFEQQQGAGQGEQEATENSTPLAIDSFGIADDAATAGSGPKPWLALVVSSFSVLAVPFFDADSAVLGASVDSAASPSSEWQPMALWLGTKHEATLTLQPGMAQCVRPTAGGNEGALVTTQDSEHQSGQQANAVQTAPDASARRCAVDCAVDTSDLEDCGPRMDVFVYARLVGDTTEKALFVPVSPSLRCTALVTRLEEIFDRRLVVSFRTLSGKLIELRPSTIRLFFAVEDDDKELFCRPLFPAMSKTQRVATPIAGSRAGTAASLNRPGTSMSSHSGGLPVALSPIAGGGSASNNGGDVTVTDGVSVRRALTPLREKELLARLAVDTTMHRTASLLRLERHYYPTEAAPRALTPLVQASLVDRLTTKHQQQHSALLQGLKADYVAKGYIPTAAPRGALLLEDQVQKFYSDAVTRENEKRKELDRKLFPQVRAPKLTRSDLREWQARMDQPIGRKFRLKDDMAYAIPQ